jgi:hypothetical protein
LLLRTNNPYHLISNHPVPKTKWNPSSSMNKCTKKQ